MFPSSHEMWRNKQNIVVLFVFFKFLINKKNYIEDINMNVVIVRFYTYMYSKITQYLGL